MCDPEIIAAILEELGYLDEKKKKDKKDEVHDEGSSTDKLKNSGGARKVIKKYCQLQAWPVF